MRHTHASRVQQIRPDFTGDSPLTTPAGRPAAAAATACRWIGTHKRQRGDGVPGDWPSDFRWGENDAHQGSFSWQPFQ
jgi:hypothetical protein